MATITTEKVKGLEGKVVENIKYTYTGAEAIIRLFQYTNYKLMYFVEGGAFLAVANEAANSDDFRLIPTNMENGAAMCASLDEESICGATSGPGITNTITGLLTAYMDDRKLILLTGNVSTNLIGTRAFQEAPAVKLTKPITTASFLVTDVRDIPEIIKYAVSLPGQFHIDVPKNLQRGTPQAKFSLDEPLESYFDKIELTPERCTELEEKGMKFYEKQETERIEYRKEIITNPRPKVDESRVDEFIDRLAQAERPFILIGGGAQKNASELIREFKKRTGIKAGTTLMGLGIDEEADAAGMHGWNYINWAIHNSDFLIEFANRNDDRITANPEDFAPNAVKTLFNRDKFAFTRVKGLKINIPFYCYIEDALEAISGRNLEINSRVNEWNDQIERLRLEDIYFYNQFYGDIFNEVIGDYVIRQPGLIEKLFETGYRKFKPEDFLFTTDIGQHQMFFMQEANVVRPKSFYTSGGAGTMGAGLPYAVSLAIKNPNKIVIHYSSDQSIDMLFMEEKTARMQNVDNLKTIIINNSGHGMVVQWQDFFYNREYAASVFPQLIPDRIKLAEAFGIEARRIIRKSEVEEALNWLYQHGSKILEIIVPSNEILLPFIPSMTSYKQIITPKDYVLNGTLEKLKHDIAHSDRSYFVTEEM